MVRQIFFFLFFPLLLNAQSAFIAGNDTICNNSQENAQLSVSFTGSSPFTFNYEINGLIQNPITTTINPYIINTNIQGVYTLVSFNDANSIGSVSGSGLVTILAAPTALIHLASDTLSIVNPTANFMSQSIGNIIAWDWNFGDNSINQSSEYVSYLYEDSIAIYQVSLIVIDSNGCLDTATHNVWVRDEFWIYIPNSFTPNYDMVNDKFCIEYHGILEETFLFKVIDSDGLLIFQSTNPLELKCSLGNGWNGKYLTDNLNLPLDTYVYEIYFQDFQGWKHQEYGTIDLLR